MITRIFKIAGAYLLILTIDAGIHAQDVESRLPGRVKIDGISDEWPRHLLQYNEKSRLSYAIADDASNLYILIESADQQTSARILRNSITAGINSKGRKGKLKTVTFPVIDPRDLGDGRVFAAGRNQRELIKDSDNDVLTKANTIQIAGFYKIPEGTFSSDLVNTYGIRAQARFDQRKVLVCEIAIPLAHLNIPGGRKNRIACNIKINGSENALNPWQNPYNTRMPGGGGRIPTTGRFPSPGNMPGMGRTGTRNGGIIPIGRSQKPQKKTEYNANTKAVNFWTKYQLGKTKL